MGELSTKDLRAAIVFSLRKQGYEVRDGHVYLPKHPSKNDLRTLNKLAVQKRLEKSGPGVRRYEDYLIRYIANGSELIPQWISPKVILVKPKSEYELLFRYVSLHWSIPVSAGYGRRLRFVILDRGNNKLIGIVGLGDPVFSMRARDQWIGWDKQGKTQRLYHVMDAYVLGAVPPYSFLLGGKLVAMLTCCNEIRNAFADKYFDHHSLITNEKRDPFLALVTTTSAFGRSSVYNRIHVNGQRYWTSLGFTQGSGDFHFANGVYEQMKSYAQKNCKPTAKHEAWGKGFRNKREVVKKCLQAVGLSTNLLYHGIRREIFAAPLGCSALPFLRGETSDPAFYDWPASQLFKLFTNRWLLRRAERASDYEDFNREQYRLWDN